MAWKIHIPAFPELIVKGDLKEDIAQIFKEVGKATPVI